MSSHLGLAWVGFFFFGMFGWNFLLAACKSQSFVYVKFNDLVELEFLVFLDRLIDLVSLQLYLLGCDAHALDVHVLPLLKGSRHLWLLVTVVTVLPKHKSVIFDLHRDTKDNEKDQVVQSEQQSASQKLFYCVEDGNHVG